MSFFSFPLQIQDGGLHEHIPEYGTQRIFLPQIECSSTSNCSTFPESSSSITVSHTLSLLKGLLMYIYVSTLSLLYTRLGQGWMMMMT